MGFRELSDEFGLSFYVNDLNYFYRMNMVVNDNWNFRWLVCQVFQERERLYMMVGLGEIMKKIVFSVIFVMNVCCLIEFFNYIFFFSEKLFFCKINCVILVGFLVFRVLYLYLFCDLCLIIYSVLFS